QRIGSFRSSATPSPFGPLHRGQSVLGSWANAKELRTNAATRMPANRIVKHLVAGARTFLPEDTGAFYPGCLAPASDGDDRELARFWQLPPPPRSGGSRSRGCAAPLGFRIQWPWRCCPPTRRVSSEPQPRLRPEAQRESPSHSPPRSPHHECQRLGG